MIFETPMHMQQNLLFDSNALRVDFVDPSASIAETIPWSQIQRRTGLALPKLVRRVDYSFALFRRIGSWIAVEVLLL